MDANAKLVLLITKYHFFNQISSLKIYIKIILFSRFGLNSKMQLLLDNYIIIVGINIFYYNELMSHS